MSKLAQFLKSHVPRANPANPANPEGADKKISNFSNISSGASENENAFANLANAPDDLESRVEEPQAAPLSDAQELARREVLAQLEAHPTVKRAFVNRFNDDGTMVVTLAIRGVGTGELLIPAARFNQETLDDYGALLKCLEESP